MANKKNNARFQETEKRLIACALELMRSTRPERLTVRAVCERAQVNRSTFYAHFLDIPDMVAKIEAQLHRELLEGYTPGEVAPLSPASFMPFLEHVRAHQEFYRAALPWRTQFPLARGREALMREVIAPACERSGIIGEDEMTYVLVSFQAGFTFMLRHWVEGGCAQDPAELARLIAACVPRPLVP